MQPEDFARFLHEQRASAILRTRETSSALPAMEAAIRGGFRIVEFTLSIPGALDLIREFSTRPGLVAGAGTVLTPEDADRCVEAGASFLVSPVCDPEVIARARDHHVAVIPGCATPTEMLHAWRAGALLQKLFPEAGPGPSWVRQTLGPLPFLRIVPTSGVTLENARAYLNAGAHAVGLVQPLFPPDDLAGGRFDLIEHRARAFLASIQNGPCSFLP